MSDEPRSRNGRGPVGFGVRLAQSMWRIRFLRFLLVGVLNTLFSYVVFATFVLVGIHYAIAAFLATVLGILFNFKTTGSFVFLNRDNRRIVRFVMVYLITYLVTVGLYRLMAMAGVNVLISAAVLALPLAFLSYALLRRLVFNQYP